MSDPTLVFRHGNVENVEAALTTAAKGLRDQTTNTFTSVDTTLGNWAENTVSRSAERQFQRRLATGIESLALGLDDLQKALADVREKAHDLEVANVAIIG